jgi:hypothetical protein
MEEGILKGSGNFYCNHHPDAYNAKRRRVRSSPAFQISPELPNPEERHMAINTLLYVPACSKAKKSHRLVLIQIANHMNSEGLGWTVRNTLARETGLSRRSQQASHDEEACHAL